MHPFLGWRDYWIFFWQDIKSDAWVNIINVHLTEVENSSTGTKTVSSGVTPIPFKFIQNAGMSSNIIPLVFVFLEYNLKHFRWKSLFSSSESDNCDLLLVASWWRRYRCWAFLLLGLLFLVLFPASWLISVPFGPYDSTSWLWNRVNSTSRIISCRNIWIYCNLIYRKFIVRFVLYSVLKIFEENSKNSNI